MKGAVCKRIYDDVIAENKKLKEENKELKGKANAFADLVMENDSLKEEIKELKEEMAMWKASYDDDIREARAEGIDELKEEVKTLDCKLNDTTAWKDYEKILIDAAQKKMDSLKKERDFFEKEFHFTLDCQVKDQEQYEKEKDSLQKSNKQKTKIIHRFKKQQKEDRERLEEQVKELQERENRMTDIADANGWDIYPTDSDESDEEE
jgi:chromosome segregation ATPase